MQIFFAMRAVCGYSSLTHAPSCSFAWRSKRKFDGTSGSVDWPLVMPVIRCMLWTSGIVRRSWPASSRSFGLWSNRSSWDGPPIMCR